MSGLDSFHAQYVASRRVRVLAHELAQVCPKDATVLDVGCGDGRITQNLNQLRPDLTIRGLDTLVRPDAVIDVSRFDGKKIAEEDNQVDVVMMVDVLHHSEDPENLLSEARRVARHALIIKDHLRNGLLAEATLRFMDRVGNARYGVALPYAYWSEGEWRQHWATHRLEVDVFKSDLNLYAKPLSWIFDRKLHFLARLGIAKKLS